MDLKEMQEEVARIVEPWKGKQGNLIMVLHQIENRFSYVPRDISFEVAKQLDIPLARIYEVITFYNYFKLEPPGKNIISVCLGTACYLKGSSRLVDAFKKQLGVSPGQTTPDKRYHVQVVRCLGCCGLAPVTTVAQKVYSNMTPERVPELIAEYADKETVGVGL
jgi:NADH-quinone oxidoreductase subunit E